jgi:ABC-type transporter lipoprotein component MlaA
MKPLVAPQVSINGTSRHELVAQRSDARAKILVAVRAMRDAMPHARDYQNQPDQYVFARAAWIERLKVMEAIADELEAQAIDIHIHSPERARYP